MAKDFDDKDFRTVLGKFPTGVVIISAMCDGAPEGMTIGAFTSVSLAPPLVAFLPAKDSVSWPRIRQAGKFTVNILSPAQKDVCLTFAKTSDTKFDGIAWEMSGHGTPHIAGALAWIDCDQDQIVDAGDHDIVLGRAVALTRGADADPLVFFGGAFHGLGALGPAG